MSGILRVYDPVECDANGVPLDYERCTICVGQRATDVYGACPRCKDHGSLKAAALAELAKRSYPDLARAEPTFRCEGCGHPTSEGTWEGEDRFARSDHRLAAYAEADLRRGREPTLGRVHYSPCDVGCRHGNEGKRWMLKGRTIWSTVPIPLGQGPVEASWRPVDVRTLGWPHDLRPEKLAVLCLRCYAERSAT